MVPLESSCRQLQHSLDDSWLRHTNKHAACADPARPANVATRELPCARRQQPLGRSELE